MRRWPWSQEPKRREEASCGTTGDRGRETAGSVFQAELGREVGGPGEGTAECGRGPGRGVVAVQGTEARQRHRQARGGGAGPGKRSGCYSKCALEDLCGEEVSEEQDRGRGTPRR